MITPRVSVLLCTRNRREFAKTAIQCYLEQTYENKELIIVDDGSDSIYDLVEDMPQVSYLWHPAKNLSVKRNAGVRIASGDFICHFDDDDWSGPNRVADQMQAFSIHPEMQIVGYSICYWYDLVRKCASQYHGSVWGATLCYRKAFAQAHEWPEDRSLAEDGPFINEAQLEGKTVGLDAKDNMVCLMHSGNAARGYDPSYWPIIPVGTLPEIFRERILPCLC